MRELAIAGFVAVVFGLGSFYATDHFGAFSIANLALGGLALLVALVAGARRVRVSVGPLSRRLLLRGVLGIALAAAAAVAIERAARWSELRFDWTFERSFEPAPATLKALAEMPGRLEVLLFKDPLDPRIRRTRLLLQELSRHGDLRVRELEIDEVPAEVDEYAVGSSNSVVIRLGDRFETIDRPTEGAIYEALYRLRAQQGGLLVLLRGEGEGDPERSDELGFSGLAEALVTEGYALEVAVSAALAEVPEAADAVVLLAPRRSLPATAVAALRRFLRRGGGLLALLEPGRRSGIEPLLAEFGLRTPDAVLIDPAAAVAESEASGLSPVAYNYEHHPITQGLDRNRMTYFSGARSFELRKPRVEDEVRVVVWASPQSWLSEDLSVLQRSEGRIEPDGARQTYHPLGVAGRYLRDGVETRIVAFGDSDFASNRYLRALYNLDLVLNAVHWILQREPEITLRPKIRTTVQFPLPVSDSLQTLYGVGLLLPEILLIAGGIVWVRRRSA